MKAAMRSNATNINKIGKMKVRNDELMMTFRVVSFVDRSGTSELPTYGAKTTINVIPIGLDKMEDIPNVIRTNPETGVKEFRVKVDYDDGKAGRYIQYHYPFAKKGEYRGDFARIKEFWDEDVNSASGHVWAPLEDSLKNPWILGLNAWKGSVPEDIAPGNLIDASVSLQYYVYVPKAKGAQKLKEQNAATTATTTAAITNKIVPVAAPAQAAEDGDDNVAATPAQEENSGVVPTRSPVIRLSAGTFSGVMYNENNNSNQTPLEAFSSHVDDDRHFLKLPDHAQDTPSLIVPVSDFQFDAESFDDVKEGPSTCRGQVISFSNSDYEKAPKDQTMEQTTARESKKNISMNIVQYGREGCSDQNFPFTVETTAYQNHVIGTGITKRDQWMRFGKIPWQGIAVVSVNAKSTCEYLINQRDTAATYNSSGIIQTYLKAMYWDIPSTCRKYGVQVSKELFPRLYADVYVDAVANGKRKILLQLDNLGQRVQPSFTNPLHSEGKSCKVINMNEWMSDAGWMLTDDNKFDFYVLPYFPLKPEMIDEGGTVQQAVAEAYVEEALGKLKELEEESLIAVLLGEETLEGVNTYHKEEMDALAAIEAEEERALAYAGRGIKVYPGKLKKTPMSWQFDFQVYAIRKDSNDTRVAETAPQKTTVVTKTTTKKKGGRK